MSAGGKYYIACGAVQCERLLLLNVDLNCIAALNCYIRGASRSVSGFLLLNVSLCICDPDTNMVGTSIGYTVTAGIAAT